VCADATTACAHDATTRAGARQAASSPCTQLLHVQPACAVWHWECSSRGAAKGKVSREQRTTHPAPRCTPAAQPPMIHAAHHVPGVDAVMPWASGGPVSGMRGDVVLCVASSLSVCAPALSLASPPQAPVATQAQ
jgi:hypothetical protein